MSEREKLIEAMVEAYNAEFNQTNIAFKRPMRAALSATEALGYRLVATEGPEFEEAVERAIEAYDPRKPGAMARSLRAALETGERDG